MEIHFCSMDQSDTQYFFRVFANQHWKRLSVVLRFSKIGYEGTYCDYECGQKEDEPEGYFYLGESRVVGFELKQIKVNFIGAVRWSFRLRRVFTVAGLF